MAKKLDVNDYPQLYQYLRQIINTTNYEKDIRLYEESSDYLSGGALSKTKIALTDRLLREYPETDPVIKSLLSHEFAHILSGDTPWQGIKDLFNDIQHLFEERRLLKDKHTRRLINIIKEIRAEIIGSSIGGLTNYEINQAQTELMKVNENTRDYYKSYSGENGKYKAYPTRIQIKYFSKRYNFLSRDVIDYFISSYFKHIGITDTTEKNYIRNRIYNRFK